MTKPAMCGTNPSSSSAAAPISALTAPGRFLLSVDYGSGAVEVYALNEAGALGARVAGRDEGRKTAHAVRLARRLTHDLPFDRFERSSGAR